MKVRELGEPTKADLKEIKEIANWLTMDAWSVELMRDKLMQVWAMGHNQGYEDANIERDSK